MRDMFSKKLQNEDRRGGGAEGGGGGGVEGVRGSLRVQRDEGQRRNKFRKLKEKLEIKEELERYRCLGSMCLSCSDKLRPPGGAAARCDEYSHCD